jgi:hypothetical protein
MATKSTGGKGRTNTGAAAGVLSQLAALAPTKATPKASGKQKWELPLTDEAKADATRWINAKAVFEPVEKRVDNAKDAFNEYALKEMATRLFNNKSKPSNPLVVLHKEDGKTVDHQFQFMMTDKFKYCFPNVPEGVEPRDHFITVFQTVGLHPNDAENLVDNELDFNPVVDIRSLSELLDGKYGEGREWVDSTEDEKNAGQKLAALLMWDGTGDAPAALTPEERALVVQRSPGIQVKAGFYDRVATYCQSVDQLLGVFKVIQPIVYPAHAKFALNDSETDKIRRKIEAAADILGTVTTDSDD